MHVNPPDQVENERPEYQPDHAQQQVSPPICEAPVERLAIATRLSLGVVSVVADAAPRSRSKSAVLCITWRRAVNP